MGSHTGSELTTVEVGAGADAVIYDNGTRRAYVPSAFDGLLTVVQVNGPRDVKVLEQVPTQVGTRTGAIDAPEVITDAPACCWQRLQPSVLRPGKMPLPGCIPPDD